MRSETPKKFDKQHKADLEIARIRTISSALFLLNVKNEHFSLLRLVFTWHNSGKTPIIHQYPKHMWKNYFKIAGRTLKSSPIYTLISIGGLVLGMSCSLLIGLWVVNESSYDDFFPDQERIYKVYINGVFNENVVTDSYAPAPLAEALKSDVPQVEYATKIANWGPRLLLRDDQTSIRETGFFASDDFFNVFSVIPVMGIPSKALQSGDQVILTRSSAEKLFDDKQALGETISMETQDGTLKSFMVGAVIEDLPPNSSLQFDWVVNFKEIEQPWMLNWGNTSYQTFLKVAPNTSMEAMEAASKEIYPTYSAFKNNYPVFQPLADVHLFGLFENGVSTGGRITLVRNLGLIGLLILFVSCINFVSLVTARASARSKEIGIRKVIGADKRTLFAQFGSESVLIATVSLLITLATVSHVLPFFNSFLGVQLRLNWNSFSFWGLLLGIWTLSLLMSAIYPSAVLARLPVFHAIKGHIRPGVSGVYFRKSLIIFQFCISALFITGILVVYSQQEYVRTKSLGLDRENILYVPLEGDLYHNLETYRQEVLKSPAVESASVSTFLPVNMQAYSGDLTWPGKNSDLQTRVSLTWVGYDFVKTMGIQLKAGREFSPSSVGDSTSYIVNQAALDMMEFEGDPIGSEITFLNGPGQIIGVMENFHLKSMHSAISPLILILDPYNTSYLLVRSVEGKLAQAIEDLGRVSKGINPKHPFNYHFLDTEYENLYRSEQMMGRLILVFGIISIFISCLGLLGLVAFTASRRVKEIGIRKVLGASAAEIVTLLSKSYLMLILLGWLIALPLSWLILSSWLDNFAYKVDLSWKYFALAGVLTFAISILTVSVQAAKAAMVNPVRSLRSE
ncbi:ABC transporter permease [Lunatibacter salilacus]|uniref:ABC transporter permease n=1 Tax=Lunatibacter salilacus TaxID=2483804 RepID=UPI00131DA273|nr:ABC transporter permease [Lunatibacter salilacus]